VSASITLDASGIAALQSVLATMAGADTLSLMEAIGIVGEDAVSENFEGAHDPFGAPWLPSLRAKTEGGKTLTDHGILANSIESQADADRVEIGTNMIYARIHNDGGVIRGNPYLRFAIPGGGFATVESVTMPKRQFLGWGRAALDEVQAQVEDWLAGLLPTGATA
jgi:phage gpG-like protein